MEEEQDSYKQGLSSLTQNLISLLKTCEEVEIDLSKVAEILNVAGDHFFGSTCYSDNGYNPFGSDLKLTFISPIEGKLLLSNLIYGESIFNFLILPQVTCSFQMLTASFNSFWYRSKSQNLSS